MHLRCALKQIECLIRIFQPLHENEHNNRNKNLNIFPHILFVSLEISVYILDMSIAYGNSHSVAFNINTLSFSYVQLELVTAIKKKLYTFSAHFI